MANKKAKQLIELGLHPVLLGNRGDSLKRPLLSGWQNANVSQADVTAWGARNNIGIRCGQTRNGRFLSVFDFDKDAASIFPQWLDKAGIDNPVTVKTGSGYHVYVLTKHPHKGQLLAGEYIQGDNGKRKTDTLIETRGDGHQVVSAGSKHPNGKRYKFITQAKYAEIPQVTEGQFKALCDLAKSFDKRPKKKIAVSPVVSGKAQGTGEYRDIHNCLDYARRFIGGEEKQEQGRYGEEIRFSGNGGLLITTDGRRWYNHQEGQGGGLTALIAWRENITLDAAQAKLRPAPNFTLYPGKHTLKIQLHAGQFLGDVEFELPKKSYLRANTGIGKTSYALQLEGRVLLVVPTQAILEQLHHAHDDADVYYQHVKNAAPDSKLIITTPDSLPYVLRKIDASLFTLVVDEIHKIATDGFRKKAYDNVVRCLNGDWERVICMTGTPLPLVTQNLEILKSVAVQAPVRKQSMTRVIYQTFDRNEDGKKTNKQGELLPAIVKRLDPKGKNIILLNNKKGQLDRLIYELKKDPRFNFALINRDTRDSLPYKTLIEDERIPDDINVLICTSVILEGFNIKSTIATAHLINVSSIEAQQFMNRARGEAIRGVYWYNTGDGRKTFFNPGRLARETLDTAKTIAARLNSTPETNPNDATFDEFRRGRWLMGGQLKAAQLIENETDELTLERKYIPSAVGVNNAVYTMMKAAENANPELFKNNMIAYGVTWQADQIETLATEDKAERSAYVKERKEERYVFLDYVLQDIQTDGVQLVRHKLKGNGTPDSEYITMGSIALRIHDVIDNWELACESALWTKGNQQRTRTLLRRLKIQNNKDNSFIQKVYGRFVLGESKTPAEILAIMRPLIANDKMLRNFQPEKLTERKAVALLKDYYTLKRTKDKKTRLNVWSLESEVTSIDRAPVLIDGSFEDKTVSLLPLVSLVAPIKDSKREEKTVSSSTLSILGHDVEAIPGF